MLRKVFARYHIIKREEILYNIEVKAALIEKTRSQYLEFCLRGILGELEESRKKIYREEQRIEKIRKAMDIYLSVLTESDSEESKAITLNYYRSLAGF